MPTQQKVTVYSGDKAEQFREGLIKTLEEAKRLAKFESVPALCRSMIVLRLTELPILLWNS